MRISELANPSRFVRAANVVMPWLSGAAAIVFAFALYRAILAPDDYQQRATVKIMFLHVPSVWLGTGSLWGRPEWGTYWVWDARLTSELILFLLYLGVIALWRTVEDPSRAARAVAILTLVGAIDLPIIKFSVDWWNTLHQGASVFRLGGSTIDPTILIPLLLMTAAFTLLFVTLLLAAMRNEILRRRVRTLRLLQASAV